MKKFLLLACVALMMSISCQTTSNLTNESNSRFQEVVIDLPQGQILVEYEWLGPNLTYMTRAMPADYNPQTSTVYNLDGRKYTINEVR